MPIALITALLLSAVLQTTAHPLSSSPAAPATWSWDDPAAAGKTDALVWRGEDAPRDRYPYLSFVVMDLGVKDGKRIGARCDATLVHSRVLLTAGHCVLNRPLDERRSVDDTRNVDAQGFVTNPAIVGRLRALVSAYDFDPARPPQPDVRASRIRVHDQYLSRADDANNYRPLVDDVALVLLEKEFPGVPTVRLAQALPSADQTMTLLGLGLTKADPSTLPTALQQGSVPFTTNTPSPTCRTANTFCTAHPEGFSGFCSGDSGGPLIVRGDSAAQDTQYGVVSHTLMTDAKTAPCTKNNTGVYDVYVSVPAYYDFIQQTIATFVPSTQPATSPSPSPQPQPQPDPVGGSTDAQTPIPTRPAPPKKLVGPKPKRNSAYLRLRKSVGATGYNFKCSFAAKGKTRIKNGKGSIEVTFGPLKKGTKYTCAITAVNSAGESTPLRVKWTTKKA